MAGGSLISRLYDFVNGMTVEDYHLDGELDLIHEWINGKLGNLNIATDANIAGSKLAVGSTPLDRLASAVYTAAQIDVLVAGAALGQVPDRSVQGVKLALQAIGTTELADGSVTAAKVAADVATQAELDTVNSALTSHTGDTALHSKVYRLGNTYAPLGEIIVPVGDAGFIPPFYVSLAAGQTAKLVKARYKINSGTSVTCKLTKNGVDITGFTGISVSTTEAETDPADVDLADNDRIALVVTGVAGTPKNMSFTIFIEYTQ